MQTEISRNIERSDGARVAQSSKAPAVRCAELRPLGKPMVVGSNLGSL